MPVYEALSDAEKRLVAILQDHSGLDLAEFSWYEPRNPDGFFRAYPYQVPWWRYRDPMTIDFCGRSVGKTLGIQVRGFYFPFGNPGHDMLITAPELTQLTPITDLIETRFLNQRLGREMMRKPATHKPHFQLDCKTNSRIMGRIPHTDGTGVKGQHPLVLEQDECFVAGTLVLTRRGQVPIEDVVVGDEVLTHKRRWRKVTATTTRERETVILRGQGHPGLEVSVKEPFWAASEEKGIYLLEENRISRRNKRFIRPEWVAAEDMEGRWWSAPTVFPQKKWVPSLRSPGERGELLCETNNSDFLWIMGLWLAEGSVGGHQVCFSVHQKEAEYVNQRLAGLGLKTSVYLQKGTLGCNVVVQNSRELGDWLVKNCGKGAHNKEIPWWVLGLKEEWRRAVLEGLIYGDGFEDSDERYAPGRWKLTTVSKKLSVSCRLLALSLGYSVSWYWNPPRKVPSVIRGQEVKPTGFYQVVGNTKGQGFVYDNCAYTKVREVTPSGCQKTLYDLTVDEDHSFVADGFCVSNSQDYPERGWVELVSTLKRGEPHAARHIHGVTIGVEGEFYRQSKHALDEPDLCPVSHADQGLYTVFRIPAMAHPLWTDEERLRLKNEFPDESEWRRNVRGLPGDALSPIFRNAALMRATEDDLSNPFNTEVYWHKTIKEYELSPDQMDILDLLVKPEAHQTVTTVWVGMDVGLINDPTEILIVAEMPVSPEKRKELLSRKKACPKPGLSRLVQIGRISLHKVTAAAQARVISWVCDNYPVKRFSMDSTGIGLPIFQVVQFLAALPNDDMRIPAKKALDVIQPYNFKSKILVAFDDRIERDFANLDDKVKEEGLYREVKDWATDQCRLYIDNERYWFPWDVEMLQQLQASRYKYQRNAFDDYGRRTRAFTQGADHCVDALRMLLLGHSQMTIDTFMAKEDEVIHVRVIDGGYSGDFPWFDG